jgi:6-phosphogluconolactonase
MNAVRLVVAMTLVLVFGSRGTATTFVYVSLSAEDRIDIYKLGNQGVLTHCGVTDTPGDPGGIAVHPSKKFLVAAMRDAGKLVSFAINPNDGSLMKINEIAVDVDPAYVEYDKTGRYLLTAYYVTGKVAVHALAEDGTISPNGKWYTTDKNAHAIITDKTNRWAFVPHTGPNAIFQFKFDESTGRLTTNTTTAKVQFKVNTGPRHFSLHHNNAFGYCDNEQGSSITAMTFDSSNGTLAPMQTLTTIPADFTKPNTCARMELHPNGKFLYASNRGHDSIAGFEIDSADGKLTPIGNFPTEKTPRGFSIDPSGKFLVAAGESADLLAVYSIEGNGRLKRIGTYPTGSKPWWVTMTTF